MKNKSINQVSIINGEDGPTSVFIFGEAQKQSLKTRIRNAIYQSRRKRIEKRIAVNPHTLAGVVQYAKDHYDLVEINPAATNWIERQKNLKASLIMQHKPELLGQRKDIPKPDFHNEESVKNFLNEMEIRNKLIDQMPDNVIPMDFHLYEIKIGEDLMEIEVDYTWNIPDISQKDIEEYEENIKNAKEQYIKQYQEKGTVKLQHLSFGQSSLLQKLSELMNM
mgnify:CR=1 FL=1